MTLFRISASSGRSRLDLDVTVPIHSLFEAIAAKINGDASSMSLSKSSAESDVLPDNNKTLADYGLTEDGTQLFVIGVSHIEADAALAPPPKLVDHREDDPHGVESSPVGGVVDGSSPVAAPSPSAPVRRFPPFELYLDSVDYDTSQLPLLNDYTPTKISKTGMNKLPAPISLKVQKYRHVDHVEIMNADALQDFVRHWQIQEEMLSQRGGIIFGYYLHDEPSMAEQFGKGSIRAVVEAIYEPSQHYVEDSVLFDLDDDPYWNDALATAKVLGLEPIGWVFTHLWRNRILTPLEICQAARLQQKFIHTTHYTGYPKSTFVTMTISPGDTGEGVVNCYQVTDLGQALVRDDVIIPAGLSGAVDVSQILDAEDQGGDGIQQHTAHDYFEIRPPGAGEIMPHLIETAKDVKYFDSDWLLVRIVDSSPLNPRPMLKSVRFPKVNRSINPNVDLSDVVNHMRSSVGIERYLDFGFLLTLTHCLGVETTETVIDCVKRGEDLNSDFHDLLNSLV